MTSAANCRHEMYLLGPSVSSSMQHSQPHYPYKPQRNFRFRMIALSLFTLSEIVTTPSPPYCVSLTKPLRVNGYQRPFLVSIETYIDLQRVTNPVPIFHSP
jgi:hypothetical protein